MSKVIGIISQMAKNAFVFVDESGTKKTDRFFSIGFLRIEDPDKLYKLFASYRDYQYGQNKKMREERVDRYVREGRMETVALLAKSPFRFELKYTHINNLNCGMYIKFIRTLCEVNFHFVSISIDRTDPNFVDTTGLVDSYKRIINLYLEKYPIQESVMMIDDFGVQIQKLCHPDRLPIHYIRAQSDSSIYLQLVDVLTGLVQHALKIKDTSEPMSKRQEYRSQVLALLESRMGGKIGENITYEDKSSYFSNWTLKFGKGHGQ